MQYIENLLLEGPSVSAQQQAEKMAKRKSSIRGRSGGGGTDDNNQAPNNTRDENISNQRGGGNAEKASHQYHKQGGAKFIAIESGGGGVSAASNHHKDKAPSNKINVSIDNSEEDFEQGLKPLPFQGVTPVIYGVQKSVNPTLQGASSTGKQPSMLVQM